MASLKPRWKKCYWCKGRMEARAGKLYCCNACKQAAYRWRKSDAPEQVEQYALFVAEQEYAPE